jgi:hypothetical protein
VLHYTGRCCAAETHDERQGRPGSRQSRQTGRRQSCCRVRQSGSQSTSGGIQIQQCWAARASPNSQSKGTKMGFGGCFWGLPGLA